MKRQNFFFLFSTSMQEKKEEKKSEKQEKHPGESKTLQQFKTKITQICLSVSQHTFISFACESKSYWKVYYYSKSSKRAESPFFCCILTQRSGLWKCTMQRVNGMGRIAAAANSSKEKLVREGTQLLTTKTGHK
jgi:hypothetical protein